jgi:hypothetical protein
MVAPHQYAKHMPNATCRYKLLLTRILSVIAKTFDFAAVPGMGFFGPVLGQIAAQCRSVPRRSFGEGGSTNRAERQT